MNYAKLKAWLAQRGTGDNKADAAALRAATEPAVGAVLVTADDFVERFAPAEFLALQSSADPRVEQFMFWLSVRREPLNLSAPALQNALTHMVSLGLLTRQRANAIGAAAPVANVAPCVLIDCALMLDMDERSAMLVVARAKEA